MLRRRVATGNGRGGREEGGGCSSGMAAGLMSRRQDLRPKPRMMVTLMTPGAEEVQMESEDWQKAPSVETAQLPPGSGRRYAVAAQGAEPLEGALGGRRPGRCWGGRAAAKLRCR